MRVEKYGTFDQESEDDIEDETMTEEQKMDHVQRMNIKMQK